MRFYVIVSVSLTTAIGFHLCKTNNCQEPNKLRIRSSSTIEEAIIFEVADACESEAEVK